MGERSPFPAVAGPDDGPRRNGDADTGGVLFFFDPRTTPKARLIGPPGAVGHAAAVLRPLLGRALHLPAGLGWNINRRRFEAAEAWWIAHGEPAAARSERRLLLRADEVPAATIGRGVRRLDFVGFGRGFRLTRQQAQVAGGAWVAGTEVRYAYYGRADRG